MLIRLGLVQKTDCNATYKLYGVFGVIYQADFTGFSPSYFKESTFKYDMNSELSHMRFYVK